MKLSTAHDPGTLNRQRKTPRQARSEATVQAILDATIQVLQTVGQSQLTTTRVAIRAGVSVGTMYQYFPHKEAILFAVLQRHMEALTLALEDARARHHGEGIHAMADGLVDVFLGAKAAHLRDLPALYLIAAEMDAGSMLRSISKRMESAVAELLASAEDADLGDVAAISFTLIYAMAGSIRALVERGVSVADLQTARRQLVLLVRGYLEQAREDRRPSARAPGIFPAPDHDALGDRGIRPDRF
jgi:AcrR family transcriptional regulator